jgi:DNA-binding CsgD family transcriptional regulator
VKGNRRIGKKHNPVIDPALEKSVLKLHRATNVRSFWKAVQQLLSLVVPNRTVGLSLQQNPGLPSRARWTTPMPDGFFTAEPLKGYAARPPHKKFVHLSDLFSNRSSFARSIFYRRYIAPQRCAHGVVLYFWKRQRLLCVIAILRPAKQGDFSPAEIQLLCRLYPQLLTALRRIESLERERSVRRDFEGFLGKLPLPTILLRWDLKPIYQNPAAREFCAVWEKGPEQAKLTKAASPIPSEILDRCRLLKQQWAETPPQPILEEQRVHHPQLLHLRATIQLRHLKSARVTRPHFVIECEDLNRNGAQSNGSTNSHLPALLRLTRREQEVARLACEGRSNKEIADNACLSLPMVKKHLHAIFRKLEVPSRSRLVTMML